MFIAFSILFRILDYFYVPKTLYWTFGSFVAEAFISSLIWIESFDAFFVEIKRLFSKKYFYKSTEDLEDLEILRTYPYFFLLVLLSKILVFYEWTIWEAVTLPILFSFTPYAMNFCSKTLKSLHDAREDDMYLPSTRNFSQQENSPVKDYYNVSIHSVFGYSNLFLFAVFSNLMTKDEISDLKAALICIGYVIHFSPVLLVKNTFKTKNLQDFMFIGLVLNLGTIMLPLSQKILVNVLFIAVSSLIKGLDKYFYPLQLTLAIVAFNLFLLQKGTQGIEVQQFLLDNKMFMLVLIAITFFLSVCLLAPTKTLIRYVYLYKDVNKGLFAVVLVLFIKMWEDVDMSSTTLDDILNNFENSFKLTSQFVILNGLALSLITKFALLTYHIADAVSLVEAGADPEYADCLIFLMTRDEEHRIKDSFYIYALKKTSDHMLILIAVLFNLVYFDTPWLRIIINFVISAFHSKSTPIIYKINLISFGSQFVIFSVFKTVFMYLLEAVNSLLALNLFKAGILAWKVDPYRYDAIRYGFIRGPELDGIPRASTGWQIVINFLALLVVIIPLNLLEYYTKTKQYKKNKAQAKRAVELILELGGIVLVWVLIYAPLYDSVFFLCISSYFIF